MTACIVNILLATTLIVSLQDSLVTGLRCHCDFCTTTNGTCETDGYCLSLTWLQRETNVVHHAFRCLDRIRFYPPHAPAQCSLSQVPNVEVRTACCNNTDMCNLHLTPALPPTDPYDVWSRPRSGTLLVNKNITQRLDSLRPKLNYVDNSTEVAD